MDQILSDEGDQDEAINYLIDALRWNSSNGWALLMMGNIFAKFKNDVPTAMKYYDQAVKNNATDNISLTNIGYLLFQQNKLEEAKKYLWEAIQINNEYPNSHLTLALIAQKENDLHSAFYSTIQAIKLSNNKDVLYQNSVKQAFEIAKEISETNEGEKLVKQYLHKLEFEGGTEIETIEDSEIPTAAKIEFAENYDRTKHIVKFKPGYPAVEHLIMHELVHLDFIIEARKNDLNQLFISTQQHKAQFLKTIEPSIKQLQKMGLPESSISKYCDSLFHGLNLQIYNTPIDLLIENFIYNEHAELRPFQFTGVSPLF
ncbi:MAG: tetratricopeptide repeat protein [Bacteroidota bacterium]